MYARRTPSIAPGEIDFRTLCMYTYTYIYTYGRETAKTWTRTVLNHAILLRHLLLMFKIVFFPSSRTFTNGWPFFDNPHTFPPCRHRTTRALPTRWRHFINGLLLFCFPHECKRTRLQWKHVHGTTLLYYKPVYILASGTTMEKSRPVLCERYIQYIMYNNIAVSMFLK